MSQPLVSIITPVYNAERFIEEAIKSVQDQTYENWELILVNDASTDNGVAIIKKFQENDKRIILIENKLNQGVANTRNNGLQKAKGDFLAYLDADDTWNPNKLKKQVAFMLKNSHVFTFTGYRFVDQNGEPTGAIAKSPGSVSFYDYLKNNIIWTTTVIVNLNVVSKKDMVMENLNYGEDAKTWLRLLDTYGDAYGLDEALADYRRGGKTLSSNKLKIVVKKFRLYQSIKGINAIQGMYYCTSSIIAATRKRL